MKKILKKIFGIIVLFNILPVAAGLFCSNGNFWCGYIDGVKGLGILLAIPLGVILIFALACGISRLIISFINWAFDKDYDYTHQEIFQRKNCS